MPTGSPKLLRHSADTQLRGPVWLAELGKPDTAMVYYMRHNSLNVRETCVGITCHLNWWFSEKEIALYDSEHIGGPRMPG